MKRARAKYITRLKYACKWLFEKQSAYDLGKIIYEKGLTRIKKYNCCANFEGSLAIYQWARGILSNKLPWVFGFKFKKRKYITKSMSKKLSREELIRRIRILEETNKRQQKRIKEIEQINEAQKEIIKIYIPKPDKNVIKKVKEEKCSSLSWRKFLIGIGINRSTFYLKHKEKQLSEADKFLIEKAKTVWEDNHQIYGREKLLIALNNELEKLNLSKTTDWILRRIMVVAGIRSILKTPTEKHEDKKNTKCKTKNLVKRRFYATRAFQIMFTDVTYYPTPKGFVYISTLVDGHDFKPKGWNASYSNDNKLVIGSIEPVIDKLSNAIIHSDHGYQYSSHEYLNLLKNYGCKSSMSRIGNSLDNYPAEHHFYFLKYEWLNRIPFEERTLERVKKELDIYYEWFNNERIQVRKNHKLINQIQMYNIGKEIGPVFAS